MRRNNLILLFVLVILYLGTGWTLDAIYGPSMGDPNSAEVPLIAHYLSILIPGFVLVLFMFTPLRRYTEPKIEKTDDKIGDDGDDSRPEQS